VTKIYRRFYKELPALSSRRTLEMTVTMPSSDNGSANPRFPRDASSERLLPLTQEGATDVVILHLGSA